MINRGVCEVFVNHCRLLILELSERGDVTILGNSDFESLLENHPIVERSQAPSRLLPDDYFFTHTLYNPHPGHCVGCSVAIFSRAQSLNPVGRGAS